MALSKSQVSQLYVSIFNRASEGAGNTYWQDKGTAAAVADAMLATTDAQTYFGTSLATNQLFVEHIYQNTLGKTVAQDPDGIAFWVKALNDGASRGTVVAELVAAVAQYSTSTDPVTKAAYDQFNNRVAVSDYMADTVSAAPADYATSTKFATSGTTGLVVTSDAATVTTAKATIAADVTPGSTFALTSSTTPDTLSGTAGHDTFTGTQTTYQTGDIILDASSGDNDTLTVSLTAATTNIPTVVGVENVVFNVTSFAKADIDVDNIRGATITVNQLQVAGSTDADLNNVGSATVKAGTGITGTFDVVAAATAAVIIDGGSATRVTHSGTTTGSVNITANSATTIDAVGKTIGLASTAVATINLQGTTGTDTATLSAKNATSTSVVALDATVAVVEKLILSGNGGAVTFDMDATLDNPTTYTFTGAQDVTIVGTAAQFDGDTATDTMTAGTSTIKIDADTAATFVLDALAVDLIDIAGTTTGATYTVANNQAVKLSVNATAVTFDAALASGSETLNLTIKTSQTGNTTVSDFEAVNLVVDDAAASVGTVTLANLVGTAASGGVIAVSGSDNLILTDANATFLNAAALSGALTATVAADLLKITGGTGNDTFNAIDADFTIDGTSGTTDTLAFAATTDLSNNTATFTNIDVIQLDASVAGNGETVTLKSSLVDGKTIIVKGTGTVAAADILAVVMQDNALDLSGINVDTSTASITISDTVVDALDVDYSVIGSNGADTLSSTATNAITIDGKAGNDVITTGAGADSIIGGSGNDKIDASAGIDSINAGEGADIVTGAAGADTIVLTETTSAVDDVVFEALGDGSTAPAAAGTFSGFDVITGFVLAKDVISFDAAHTTTATIATAWIEDSEVLAQTAGSTTAIDLTDAEYTDLDSVVAFLADANTIVNNTSTDDYLFAVTFSNFTALYVVKDDGDDTVSAGEVRLLGTVDAVLTATELDIA